MRKPESSEPGTCVGGGAWHSWAQVPAHGDDAHGPEAAHRRPPHSTTGIIGGRSLRGAFMDA
eukprot:6992651-Alexandrium_andersonii.AAC.1